MKVGVLGGTFDPIHRAHLVVARQVRERLGLGEVWFVPAGQPWLKVDHRILAAAHRVEMVRRAIARSRYFKLSTVEIERPGPSYTVDTIAEMCRQLGGGTEVFFIMGWDSLNNLPHWRDPARLMQLCRLVVVPRPGIAEPRLGELEKALPGLSERVIMMQRPQLDISSSEVRQRVAQHLPIAHLVPGVVENYIHEHGLYVEG